MDGKKKDYRSERGFKQTASYGLMFDLLVRDGISSGILAEEAKSLLDIGCGDGSVLWSLTKKSQPFLAVGLDICFHKQWKGISHRSGISFVVADANHLPFRQSVFAFVFLKDIIHHIQSKKRMLVLGEAFNVTRQGGRLRMVEPNRYNINSLLIQRKDKDHDHYTLDQLQRLKKSFRFDESYGFQLPPSFSNSRKHFLWNGFVFFFWLLTTYSKGQHLIAKYLWLRERIAKSYITYCVLGKQKS